MQYQLAERFKSVQGEGVYAGTPMAFIRFVGCSVGKTVCAACDTDFERPISHLGGGLYESKDLAEWAMPYSHICFTGGEPFDQDLRSLTHVLGRGVQIHVETSGTVQVPDYFMELPKVNRWICVSPKPGYKDSMINAANEIKVIIPGLGVLKNGVCDGWPTIHDAKRWADEGKIVFLQPRNDKNDINPLNLKIVDQLVNENPNLRLSVQLHKLLRVR